MFTTIFRYETQHWLRQPATYIYTAFFFLVGIITMAGEAQAFDPHTSVTAASKLANSPLRLISYTDFLMKFVLVLLPAVMGASIYRDFKSNTYSILYSYPITKKDYLFGKFFSSFFIVAMILACFYLGLLVGTQVPGVNEGLLGSFNGRAYLQTYVVYLLPNILCFGVFIFVLVAITRNIYIAFIAVVFLFVIQGILSRVLGTLDQQYFLALLDPIGIKAAFYPIRYWDIEAINHRMIPFNGIFFFNRLIWFVMAGIAFLFTFRVFHLAQNALSFRWTKKSNKQERQSGKSNAIFKVNLPLIKYDYSFASSLKKAWRLSYFNFQFILRNWAFIGITLSGLVFVIFVMSTAIKSNQQFSLLPLTSEVLDFPVALFRVIIILLTFLFAGMLVHRARTARIHQLVDVSPISNWVLLLSHFLALVRVQVLLSLLIMLCGITIQLSHAYYKLEIGHYLIEIFGLNLLGFIIWAMAALFVQTLIPNLYLGFFILFIGNIAVGSLGLIGLENEVFAFNQLSEIQYSNLDGYGAGLSRLIIFNIYWFIAGLILLTFTLLLWKRGLSLTFRERWQTFRSRLKKPQIIALSFFIILFIGLGLRIYFEDYYFHKTPFTFKDRAIWMLDSEKKFKRYENLPQPIIKGVKIDIDIYPASKSFKARGRYRLLNKFDVPIDTLVINYSLNEISAYHFQVPVTTIIKDQRIGMDVLVLDQSLAKGDNLLMYFEIENKPNTIFRARSKVRDNGTMLFDGIFPKFGYRSVEITNNGKRKKYGLPPIENTIPPPSDTTALGYGFGHRDKDWIDFEAIVSTSEDQIALTAGYLQKEWKDQGRRFFHYKSDTLIKHEFAFHSGRYVTAKEHWNGIDLEIYYDPDHSYNLDRIMNGLKGSIQYGDQHFTAYPHRQVRVIEFPILEGVLGTTLANTIPLSETHFLADVHDDKGQIDFPFYVTAHEVAHQWWGNLIMTAKVQGQKMLTESLAEYVALKVLEKHYGKTKMRKFLKLNLDRYLRGRRRGRKKELPLILNEGQRHMAYSKGALVFYALSDFLGEENLNGILKTYLQAVAFQEPPFTTSLEMVDYIKKVVPDSLDYLIVDLFETVTLYDNKIVTANIVELENRKYQVDFEFSIRKYQLTEEGEKQYAKDLADYIEIGVFGVDPEKEIYLKKHKISKENHKMRLILDQKPFEVGIDPYNKLIDAVPDDNRMKL